MKQRDAASQAPEIQAQLLAARRGDLVRIVGVVKGRGSNIRILSCTLIEAAPNGPELVPNVTAETETNSVAA